MDVKKEFGENLARVRRSKGVSQEKLALDSGLARSYISGVERGRRNISLINICILATHLGVLPSELLKFPTST
tara:strand:- start:964 stop:1182 length:219 start_codon:yes stop_codon:yes gene_type:complete